MKTKVKQSGLTLTEQIVVVAAIAVLVSVGLPAIRSFVDSMESSGAARAVINSAMASAKAIAVKQQKYAGIRFQHEYNSDDPLEVSQYMIFIIYDDTIKNGDQGNLGCRAVEGIEPIKLPSSICVMDLKINDNDINSDTDINGYTELRDTTTFSILFSPSGKLIIHKYWVKGRSNDDDMFNSESNITSNTNPAGMFLEDKNISEIELSRKSFIVCNRFDLKQAPVDERYTKYLERLKDSEMTYINPYTGRMIEQK